MENPKIGQFHRRSEYLTKAASQIRENVDFVQDSPVLKDTIDSFQLPNKKKFKMDQKAKHKKINTNIRNNHIQLGYREIFLNYDSKVRSGIRILIRFSVWHHT